MTGKYILLASQVPDALEIGEHDWVDSAICQNITPLNHRESSHTSMLEIVCNYGNGSCPFVAQNPASIAVTKRVRIFEVEFVKSAVVIDTLEGQVSANSGDAVITGIKGERWPVASHRFLQKYEAVNGTKFGDNGSYRSIPTSARALQMGEPFEVRLPDGVSRLKGLKGDWLVDYGDGSLGVVNKSIFESTYLRRPQPQ